MDVLLRTVLTHGDVTTSKDLSIKPALLDRIVAALNDSRERIERKWDRPI